MPDITEPMTDADKLRLLADWLDAQQSAGHPGDDFGSRVRKDLRRIARKLHRFEKGWPHFGRDHRPTDAEWRALVKPLVMTMDQEGLTRIEILKDGGEVRFNMS
jgi:hypothetical protein